MANYNSGEFCLLLYALFSLLLRVHNSKDIVIKFKRNSMKKRSVETLYCKFRHTSI